MKHCLIITALLCILGVPLAALTVKPPDNLNRQTDYPATVIPGSNAGSTELPQASPAVTESPAATESQTPGVAAPQPASSPQAPEPQAAGSRFPAIMLGMLGLAVIILVLMLYARRK